MYTSYTRLRCVIIINLKTVEIKRFLYYTLTYGHICFP